MEADTIKHCSENVNQQVTDINHQYHDDLSNFKSSPENLDKVHIIYTTWPHKPSAKLAVKDLLNKGFVACVNFIDKVESMYNYDDELYEEEEVIAIFKTIGHQVEDCISEIKKLHPYENPCIFAIQADEVSEAYNAWVNIRSRNKDTSK